MKYRIIQRKDEKYEIQRKFLGIWFKHDYWSSLDVCRDQIEELREKKTRRQHLPKIIEEFEV